ncbi:MAG: cobalamin biosynthesis protein [Sporichthyaceae bacterium]
MGAGTARALGLAVGFLGDAVLADPRRGHPVAGFGRAATALERRWWRDSGVPGAAHTAVCVGTPVLAGVALERLAGDRGSARVLGTALATWAVLGGASLAREGAVMSALLRADDLPGARARLSHLCARDATALDGAALARATVESLAENTSDAVLAPLLAGALAGIPGLLGYRAINTLDAMVGYRSTRYARFGMPAARLDDLANLAPARLTGLVTVALAPAVGGRPAAAARALWADRRAHPSPNAGWCEAAAAGALGVRLGGRNSYDGATESRPVLNAGGRAPQIGDIARAVRLSRLVGVAGLALACAVASGLGKRS